MPPRRSTERTTDTADLLAARAGDRAAFGRLVSRHQGRLFGYAHALVHERSAAEDITAEVFLRAWVSLPLLDPNREVVPWLLRVAHRLSIDWLRRQRVRRSASLDALGDSSAGGRGTADRRGAAPGPEQAALTNELHFKVREALGVLPAADREVLHLKYVEELSAREIAFVLAVPVSTVNTRLHSARQRLRARLDPYIDMP